MTAKPFMCGACHKRFAIETAVRDHILSVHRSAGSVGIFHQIGTAGGRDHDASPSMADLAVQASIDRAMGIPNDDDWLLA
jgi:hypothetical protein